ncbi:MAG TPA: tripartite tricarboxylate transporter substrate binding protein [Burkholderiales bacterium]|nr:tripartite tricarboxylate transporter substrate binding protein [Burkholderiales bacterium]
MEREEGGGGEVSRAVGVLRGAPLLCAAALVAASAASLAQQGYPSRPIRIVVPSSAGGGIDIVARVAAPRLAERLGQQVLIDNRPGAGTMIGSELVARAPADGYTLLMSAAPLSINPAIYKKLPYEALRDFAPITLAASYPNVLVVHPSLPVASVQQLIAFARARPGQLSYGSAGIGTNPHFAMELFRSMAKLDLVHVPYKGSAPAVIDLVAGHVQLMAGTMITVIPHVRSGRLRALAVSSARRAAAAPELPTIAESGLPGYEAIQWYGLLAPAQTPKEIVARLHDELVRVLQLPDVKAKIAEDGGDPVGDTPEEFARFMRADTEKWAKLARVAGIKPE